MLFLAHCHSLLLITVTQTFELASKDPYKEAKQVLTNLGVLLEEVGSSLEQIMKLTIFMTDMNDFPLVNQAINEGSNFPFCRLVS